jgi:lipopolysaccharide/colanic/teichoic acid biosynthesis glycosyltransferase
MAATSLFLSRALPVQSVSTTERLAAAVVLGLVSPALLPVLGAVRILSGRTPLVAHLRVGQFGQPLWVIKVRTMWCDGARSGWIEYLNDPVVSQIKTGRDPRVTSAFAAFCRRHSIDELPQLLHVAAGTMSWVGPRPMTRGELEEFYGPDQAEVLSAPPGLTGLWQVLGRNRLTYRQRRRLDLFLVRRLTWRLRARVLVRTVKEVLLPRYAW